MKLFNVLITSAACCLMAAPTFAQDAPGRGRGEGRGFGGQQAPQRLAPEDLEAAWALEARSVAMQLGLAPDATKTMTMLYLETRQSQAKALRELMQGMRGEGNRPRGEGNRPRGGRGGADRPADDRPAGGPPPEDRPRGDRPRGQRGQGDGPGAGRGAGDGPGAGRGAAQRDPFVQAAINKLNQTERGNLSTALAEFLEPDQVKKAMIPLGTFDRTWDNLVASVAALEIEEATTLAAMEPIQAYVLAMSEAREARDRDAMRDARATMAESMKSILGEEQAALVLRRTGAARRSFADRMKQYDANGDGKLQESEVPEQMLAIFDRLDANGDGEIDAEEMAAMQGRGRRGRGGGISGGAGL